MTLSPRRLAVIWLLIGGIAATVIPQAIRGVRLAVRRMELEGQFRGDPVKDFAFLKSILDEVPIVSLDEQLAYERDRKPASDSQPIQLSQSSERLLRQSEQAWEAAPRLAVLSELHSAKYIEFVEANGFGTDRMGVMQPDRRTVVLPELAWFPLPRSPAELEPMTAIQNPVAALRDSESFPDAELASLHQFGSSDFTDPNRLGFVVKSRQVSGFQPHAFTRDPNSLALEHLAEWQVSRLQLVGLLKFPEPRVYDWQGIPRMDVLKTQPNRALDDFEQQALRKLYNGEDVVTAYELNHIRMVGAVRAAKQCLDCHSVRRGDLLGAFSYLLDRKQPLPPPKVEGRPVSLLLPVRE